MRTGQGLVGLAGVMLVCWAVAGAQAAPAAVAATDAAVVAPDPAATAATPADPAAVAATDAAVVVPDPAATAVAAPAAPDPATAVPEDSAIPELMIYSDEALVSTASKHLQKLSEVPGSVAVITGQEIRERNALTLSEILFGFTGTELTHEGIFETVRFRGMQSAYNNKILVLLDGRKLNTIDWGNFNDTFGNNLDNIKQIEIIKGPGSALYGANAFAGVINIITKDGAALGGLYTKLSIGTKNGDEELSRYLYAAYGKRAGEWDVVVDAGYWAEHGVDLINRTPNDFYEGDRFSLALKQGDRFSLRAGFHNSHEPYPGLFFNPTPKQKAFQDTLYLDAKYVWELNELSQLTARLEDTGYLKREVRQTNFRLPRTLIATPADLPAGAAVIVDDHGQTFPVTDAVGRTYIDQAAALSLLSGRAVFNSYWSGPENELLAEVQYDLAWPESNYLLAGVSYTHDWSGQNYFITPTVSDQNYAAYLQDELHAWDNLLVLAGARFDYNTAYGSNFSPRGSLIYTLAPGFRLKALYGSAFRAPVFLERYTRTTVGYITATGNPDLKPEKTQQTEAGVEYEFGKWLQVNAGAFYWETQDEIQPSTYRDPMYVYSPDLSQINPAFPTGPGLYYSTDLNQLSTRVEVSNNNSRLGKGFEIAATAHPLNYTKFTVNYAHYNLLVTHNGGEYIVDEGDSDVVNAQLGFNYENLFFLNLYGHLGASPRTIWTDAVTISSQKITVWLNQFDVTAGVRIRGVNVVLGIYNALENDVIFNQANSSYIKGPRVTRISADYSAAF